MRWDGWVTDDGSAVHPSSVQLSIGDRGVEPPDRARAWRGWNGADVGPVVDPDAKDERRARSNGGRDARIRERVAIREQPTLLGGLGALSVYRRTTAHPGVVVLVGARMNGTLA